LRRLLVQCAHSFIMRLEHQQGRLAEWVRKQLDNKHSNIVSCALANKLARIAWQSLLCKKNIRSDIDTDKTQLAYFKQ
ncbi:TPA: IS110 family transposase, partial [Klebsiella pneumoniae]|nr:IS110 family transposase [Klebsiella pneumoniae]